MANNLIVLLAVGTTTLTSATFEVNAGAPVSLYLVPQAPATDAAAECHITIQRQTSTGWSDVLNMRGGNSASFILLGQGTFRAHREAQNIPVGLELVEQGA